MAGPRGWGFSDALLTFCLLAGVAQARILVDLVHIGFPVRDYPQGVVRTGYWTPLVVDVTLEGEAAFDGVLRLAQPDADGDLATDMVEVHLLTSTGGQQRYWLYFLPNPVRGPDQIRIQIELLDAEGQATQVIYNGAPTYSIIPEDPVRVLSARDKLIMSISATSVGPVIQLQDPQIAAAYFESPWVGHLPAKELPTLWLGLESVNFLIWDEADTADLTAQQLEAVAEWVRQGGTLVIAAGRTSDTLAQSPTLASLLPVTIGTTRTVTDLEDFRHRVLQMETKKPDPNPSVAPVTVSQCALREGSRALYQSDGLGAFLSEKTLERGRVVFCAASLREIFSHVGANVQIEEMEEGKLGRTTPVIEFFHRVLLMRKQDRVEYRMQPLYRSIEPEVSFRQEAGVNLIISILFTAIYFGVASFGTWFLLKQRGWERHSWTAFSAVAMASSLLSIIVVKANLGLGEKVEQVSIIDVNAGDRRGYGTALFSIRTGSHAPLDVWLPSDPLADREPAATPCSLKPAPFVPMGGNLPDGYNTFIDTRRYRVGPGTATLEGLPLRATMKRLDGRWNGPIDGRVTGAIRLDLGSVRRTGTMLSTDSYVENDLKTPLTQCYLMLQTANYFEGASMNDMVKDRIFALDVGRIGPGERVDLAKRCRYADPAAAKPEELRDSFYNWAISNEQWRWRDVLSSLNLSDLNFMPGGGKKGNAEGRLSFRVDPYYAALLLAGAYGEIATVQPPNSMMGFEPPLESNEHLDYLNLRGVMSAERAVLIGVSEDVQTAPIQLAVRRGDRSYRTVQPSRSHTVYRVHIPVEKVAVERKNASGGDAAQGEKAAEEPEP